MNGSERNRQFRLTFKKLVLNVGWSEETRIFRVTFGFDVIPHIPQIYVLDEALRPRVVGVLHPTFTNRGLTAYFHESDENRIQNFINYIFLEVIDCIDLFTSISICTSPVSPVTQSRILGSY